MTTPTFGKGFESAVSNLWQIAKEFDTIAQEHSDPLQDVYIRVVGAKGQETLKVQYEGGNFLQRFFSWCRRATTKKCYKLISSDKTTRAPVAQKLVSLQKDILEVQHDKEALRQVVEKNRALFGSDVDKAVSEIVTACSKINKILEVAQTKMVGKNPAGQEQINSIFTAIKLPEWTTAQAKISLADELIASLNKSWPEVEKLALALMGETRLDAVEKKLFQILDMHQEAEKAYKALAKVFERRPEDPKFIAAASLFKKIDTAYDNGTTQYNALSKQSKISKTLPPPEVQSEISSLLKIKLELVRNQLQELKEITKGQPSLEALKRAKELIYAIYDEEYFWEKKQPLPPDASALFKELKALSSDATLPYTLFNAKIELPEILATIKGLVAPGGTVTKELFLQAVEKESNAKKLLKTLTQLSGSDKEAMAHWQATYKEIERQVNVLCYEYICIESKASNPALLELTPPESRKAIPTLDRFGDEGKRVMLALHNLELCLSLQLMPTSYQSVYNTIQEASKSLQGMTDANQRQVLDELSGRLTDEKIQKILTTLQECFPYLEQVRSIVQNCPADLKELQSFLKTFLHDFRFFVPAILQKQGRLNFSSIQEVQLQKLVNFVERDDQAPLRQWLQNSPLDPVAVEVKRLLELVLQIKSFGGKF